MDTGRAKRVLRGWLGPGVVLGAPAAVIAGLLSFQAPGPLGSLPLILIGGSVGPALFAPVLVCEFVRQRRPLKPLQEAWLALGAGLILHPILLFQVAALYVGARAGELPTRVGLGWLESALLDPLHSLVTVGVNMLPITIGVASSRLEGSADGPSMRPSEWGAWLRRGRAHLGFHLANFALLAAVVGIICASNGSSLLTVLLAALFGALLIQLFFVKLVSTICHVAEQLADRALSP